MAGGKKGQKVLNLGARLKYPITITKLYKNPGEELKQETPVLQYSFTWTRDVLNKETGQEEPTEVTSVTDWSAPEDAKLIAWNLRVGDIIARNAPCLTVEEACTHEVQFQGLCAICGKDMNEVSWASEHRDTERAPINMTHDQTSLLVSGQAAARAEHELQKRLLKQRKLSLVVDLDQTIIHACIEPTIGEWQRDPTSPNYEAVKDVRSFQLDDGPRGLASGCWYYIKLRPGLVEFLNKIAEMYELHVYTMGTRAYAMNIAKIVDPDQKLFGNRVISRDENGSLTAKSLQRLFPVSTNMVVIIDDRADVWPRNRPNLIKVVPYDFFKGIGDINSSFLPKREDLLAGAPPGAVVNGAPKLLIPKLTNGGAKVSALEELASMGGGENSVLLQKQTEEQAKSLEKQIKDRPLLHMQEELEKEEATENVEPNGDVVAQSHPHARHPLLLDDDQELVFLEEHLTQLHQSFYNDYEAKCAASSQSGRTGSWDENAEMSTVPDAGAVLDGLKSTVLHGTSIVLSGLVPLGVDVKRSEIGLQALSFGARLQNKVSERVTHLVISSDRPRTQKVRQAARIPSIKIVNQNWLADSLSQWAHLDETPYLIELHPADRLKLSATATPNEMTDAETVSDIDTDDNAPAKRNGSTRLKIVVSGLGGEDEEADDSDDEDDGDEAAGGGVKLDDPEMSPIEELKTFDWGSAEDELAEFLADGDDEDDDEEMGDAPDAGAESDAEVSDTGGAGKRKLSAVEADTESDADGVAGAVKKQRVRSSGLRVARTPGDDDSSLPTPQVTGDEEDVMLLRTKASQTPEVVKGDDEEGDNDDDGLEADLLAELEAEEAAAVADKG